MATTAATSTRPASCEPSTTATAGMRRAWMPPMKSATPQERLAASPRAMAAMRAAGYPAAPGRPPGPPRAGAGGEGSGLLDDEQRVAVGVAEPEHRRDRVAHARDLGVHVDAGFLELGVGGVDVVGAQADAGVNAGRVALARRSERDPRVAARRVDLDPAVAAAEGDVGALLE